MVGEKIAGIAARKGKYESLKDDSGKLVDDEGSEVETKQRIFSRRDIVHSILIGAAFFAFAWITVGFFFFLQSSHKVDYFLFKNSRGRKLICEKLIICLQQVKHL